MNYWFSHEFLFCAGLIIGSGLAAYAFMRWENREKNDQRVCDFPSWLDPWLSLNSICLLAQ